MMVLYQSIRDITQRPTQIKHPEAIKNWAKSLKRLLESNFYRAARAMSTVASDIAQQNPEGNTGKFNDLMKIFAKAILPQSVIMIITPLL